MFTFPARQPLFPEDGEIEQVFIAILGKQLVSIDMETGQPDPNFGDDDAGIVYLPVSTPTNDYWGGMRHGENVYAESLVAINAETGERIWHFQTVHHGIWDYDLASAPNLVDIVVDGRPIKAMAQVSKTGFTYVFDRLTGEPVWPIEERPAPPSTVPGERLHPTQPIPTWPLPFEQIGITEEDLIDFTPELCAEAEQIASEYVIGPIFLIAILEIYESYPDVA